MQINIQHFDIHGSVHRTLLSRNTNKMQLCNRIYYSKGYKGSTCFERRTVQHQELKTLFAASGLYAHMVTGRCQGWVGTAVPS
jgi:hypothetical protein